MTVLTLALGATEVAVTADGRATQRRPLRPEGGVPATELAAELVWRGVLDALGAAVADLGGTAVAALRVHAPSASLALWDAETLGSPRPIILGPDPRADPAAGLAWIAAHEPHTWALVLAERYAAGPLASYVVARMTRGLDHVTTDPAWSADRAAELGVPPDVLPELVTPDSPAATTDPRVVLGLRVPISLAG